MRKTMLALLVATGTVFLGLPSHAMSAAPVTPVCGTANDTAAVQAAIDSGGVVQLPVGVCSVSSLNGTNRMGLTIVGYGLNSQIVPIQSGVNVIDLTGSSNATLYGFRICGFCNMAVVPITGILSAQSSGSYSSDVTIIRNVRVDGKFSLAAWYNLALASSMVESSQFYNYTPGGFAAVITGNNFFGAHSDFTAIDNSNSHTPSDLTLSQVEIHELGGTTGDTGLWVGGMQSVRMYGGNISSSGYSVSYNAVMINGGVAYPANNVFDGTTFYSDFPPFPACRFKSNTGSYPAFRANDAGGRPLQC